jgi:hypothetical protein
LIEIGLLVLKKILNFFLLFCYYLLLGKRVVPLHLNNLESHPPKEDLYQLCSKLASGSGEEVENVKVYRQTDDGQWVIRKAHLSFQLR